MVISRPGSNTVLKPFFPLGILSGDPDQEYFVDGTTGGGVSVIGMLRRADADVRFAEAKPVRRPAHVFLHARPD